MPVCINLKMGNTQFLMNVYYQLANNTFFKKQNLYLAALMIIAIRVLLFHGNGLHWSKCDNKINKVLLVFHGYFQWFFYF